MILKLKLILLVFTLILGEKSKAAENIFLYNGTLSRSIKIESLQSFKKTKKPNNQLKNLMKITNIEKNELLKALSYEIDVPINMSSKLMNSKIGEVFLSRIAKIIYPNKLLNKEIGKKAIRSAIIISSYKNNQKINLIEFFKAYPNKNIALDLNALGKTLKKVESLTELIEFYSTSPLKKLKDGGATL